MLLLLSLLLPKTKKLFHKFRFYYVPKIIIIKANNKDTFYYVPKIIIIKANNKETKFLYIYRLRPNCVSKIGLISNFFYSIVKKNSFNLCAFVSIVRPFIGGKSKGKHSRTVKVN